MKKYLIAGVFAGFLFAPLSAFAYPNYCTYNMSAFCSAEVIYKSNTCSYDVAEDSMGNYFIFEWLGGSYPLVGNTIYGQWYSYVIKTMYNLAYYGYPATRIYVVSPMVSQYNLLEQYSTYCPSL